MKKKFTFIAAITAFVLLTALISSPVSVEGFKKTANGQKEIPVKVMKVIDNSCIGCHSESGMKMAVAFLDLSAWDKYSPGKQAAKAKKMCKFVTKSKMPPKRYRANNPDAVPTKADITTICEWSASLKVVK